MITKNIGLNRNNIASYSNITIGVGWNGANWVETQYKMNNSDCRVSYSDWYGDACIGSLGASILLDGQWILTTGWGDGTGLIRITDAGAITHVYGTSAGNGYSNNHCLAWHEPTKTAYISQHNTPCMGVLDLSAWYANGKPDAGTGIVYYQNIYKQDATWNFPSDQCGTSYENGLCMCGDWLYFATYARNTINGVYRWNVYTHNYEVLTIANLNWNTAYWEGTFVYDTVLDKLFYQLRWTGGLNIIENASTANPTAFHISFSGHGSDHCTNKGIVYIGGDTNRILTGGEWRFFDLNISSCSPTNQFPVFNREVYVNSSTTYNFGSNYFQFGSNDPYNYDETKGGNPYGPGFIQIYPDRGWNRKTGWFDLDNFKPTGRTGEDSYSMQKDMVMFDYYGGYHKVTTANSTNYWVALGYSWDGHKVNVYSQRWLLFPSSEIVFDLSNGLGGDNIAAIDLSQSYNIITPSNTCCSLYVSNDGGSTYEVYAGGVHTFSSTGINGRVKYVFTGTEYKMPYLNTPSSVSPVATLYAAGYLNASNAKTLNYKITGI